MSESEAEDDWETATVSDEPEVVAHVKWLQYHRFLSRTSAHHQLDPQTNAIRIILRGNSTPSILITADQVLNADGTADTNRSSEEIREIISDRSTPAATITLDGREIPINSVLYMLGLKAGRDGEESDPDDAIQAALPPVSHTLRGRMGTADLAEELQRAPKRRVTLTTQPGIPGAEHACPHFATPGSDAASLSLSYQPEGSSRYAYINACTSSDFRSLDDTGKCFWDNAWRYRGIRRTPRGAGGSNAGGEGSSLSLGSLLSGMFSQCLGRRME